MSTSSPSQEFQEQMMTMLNTTFTKLTTVMSEARSNESKADWPKFAGDTRKFKTWYLAIVAQLSIAPWKEFYDSTNNTVIKTTGNTALNEKLYAKLLLCLEGQVLQDMVSRKHLRANGLLLLSELSQTYRPSHVPEVTAAKTVEFWSTLKRSSNESVDAYYNRFQALLDDLDEAGEPIPIRSAIRQFLFTLGADFAPIQNNYRIGLLPEEWKTTDWPSLLVLCRDYANSVCPHGHKQDSSSDKDGYSFDRSAHHKKVKQWFMNPVKFRTEMEAEQNKNPGKCLYHLTKSHPTCDCYIKKECDKLLATERSNGSNTSSSNSQSGTNGQLRNITELVDEDTPVDEDDIIDTMLDSNDTNEEELFYFTRIKNHYLHLVKSSSSSRHSMDYPIIVDSGANYHMFREKEFFTSLVPTQGKVVLGDGKTTLDIHGIGQIKCMIGPNTLIIDNVRHVPDLAQSIYSLFLHIKQQQHGIQSSFDDGLHLKFPTFTTKTIVGSADIYLDAVPHPDNHGVSEESSIYSDNAHHTCHHTIIHQSNVEPSKDDNLLQSIRQYYAEIKTKQQLNLNLPAGFRSSSSLQKDYNIFAPPCKARSAEVLLPTTETLDQPTTENSTPTIATLSSIESNTDSSVC